MPRKLRAGLTVAALMLVPATDAAAASYGSRPLDNGTSGSDVRALQRYLDAAGYQTMADGQFGPATVASLRHFERAEGRRPNGTATRYEQRLVRSRAAAAAPVEQEIPETTPPAPEKAYLDGNGLAVAPASAPPEVHAIIAAGNEIATKPYKTGGGHGRWRDSGYDCSGSVAYLLHAAGLLDTWLDSTGFMSWEKPGRGTWVTIRANEGHAYMVVAGLRFDTIARKQTGTRWSETMQSARGYHGRHPEGL